MEGHPNPSGPIHQFLPTLIPGKDWNRCKYMLATNIYIFMKNRAQQQAQAQRNMHIPKWEYLPNWESSSKLIHCNPPHRTHPGARTKA